MQPLTSVDDLPFAPDAGEVKIGAGVAYVAPGGAVLFLRRSPGGDHEGEWSYPGGGVEDGETTAEAAAREFEEETGRAVDPGTLALAACHAEDGATYATFVAHGERFDPTLDDENDAAIWAPLSDPPVPLHPKLAAVIGQVAAAVSVTKADTVSTATGIVNYDQTSASRRVRRIWRRRRPVDVDKADQARDDHGRFASGGGSAAAAEIRDRAAAHQAAADHQYAKEKELRPTDPEAAAHYFSTASLHEGAAHNYGLAADHHEAGDATNAGIHAALGDRGARYAAQGERAYGLTKKVAEITKGAAMGEQISFFMPLTKKEPQADGSVVVTGYASTPTKDLDDEVISLDAVKKALPSYMEWRNIREMHQPSAVGVAKEAHVDDVGLYLRAKIVEPGAVRLVNEGVYQGFSIGGRKLAKKGDTVTELELVEISIVDRPCNPDTRFAIAKSAAGSAGVGVINPRRIDLVRVAEGPIRFTAPIELEREEVGLIGRLIQKLSGAGRDGEVPSGTARTEKRDVSDAERVKLESEGHAMPGGGYPIKDRKDLENAVQAFGRAKNKAATKRHIISEARRLGALDALPDSWGVGKLAKAANLYTVSSMIELLGRLEYLEECCEGVAGFCCEPTGGSETIIRCDKAFTDKFGALLVQFADMTSELLDQAVAQMKKEEADEAAAKAVAALGRTKENTMRKAAKKRKRAVKLAAKLVCATGLDLKKNWSDAAKQAATDARGKAAEHRALAANHFGQQAEAEGRGDQAAAVNHAEAGSTHMQAARNFDRAADAVETDGAGAVAARAQHLSGKFGKALAFASDASKTLAFDVGPEDDLAGADVMESLAVIAKRAGAGPRPAEADDPFAELRGRLRLPA